jgi:hypothetical protein
MTTDKPTPELLPCPFCGGEACTKEWTVGSHDQIKIWCDSEHCEVYPSVFGNKISKIIAWNTRPSELRQAGVEAKPALWIEKDEFGDYLDYHWSSKEQAEGKGIKVYPLYEQPAAQKTEGADCCDVDLSETVWHDKYHTLCEQSWKALGISEYTGLSIPEHIAALASRASVDVEALKRETVENTVGKFHSYGATRRDAEHWIKMAIDRLAETGRLHASHTGGKTE